MKHLVRPAALVGLFCVLVGSVAGCQEKRQAVAPAGHGRGPSAPASKPLPPPGNPAVGERPPMPATVVRPAVDDYKVETWVSGLEIPWDIAFVSRTRAYVTERPGRLRLIENGRLVEKPYVVLPVRTGGEGGLMGIALHPKYPNPRWVYLMYTYTDGGRAYNRVSRFMDTGAGLTGETAVVTRIPAGGIHNGGALEFGPDGMLYIGTGDTHEAELAQNRSSLAGKVLRVMPDGKIPSDNPFKGSPVYAYGLRNVQGLAWNPANRDLWVTMHGPTGEFGLYAKDSVFIVGKGANCGWPRSLGVTGVDGVTPPVLWYPDNSNPPGGAAFYTGSLMPGLKGNFFFSSLAGEHLERVVLSGPRKISRIERWWETGSHQGRYGRLRAVVQGPDGALYVSTSNRDGRGNVNPGDDRILRISAK